MAWRVPPSTWPGCEERVDERPRVVDVDDGRTATSPVSRSTSTSRRAAAQLKHGYASPRYVSASHSIAGVAVEALVDPRRRRAPGRRRAYGSANGRPVPCLHLARGAAAAARTTRPPTIIVVREATVGPLFGTSDVSCGRHLDVVDGTPSASAAICARTVREPWPISVESIEDADRAVVRQLDAGDAREVVLAAAGEPAPCQPSAMPHAVAPGRTGRARRPRRCAAVRAARVARSRPPPPPRRGPRRPRRSSRRTWPVGVTSPSRYAQRRRSVRRRDPQGVGDPVHLHLRRELRLRRAEAAEGAVGRRVRRHRARPDPDVRARRTVRRRGSRRARGRPAMSVAVRARVHDHLDLLGHERRRRA